MTERIISKATQNQKKMEVLHLLWPPKFLLDSGNIPEEIVTNILPHLPIKTLLRFRCVSKSWRSSISDPKFSFSSQRRRRIIMKSGYLYTVDAEEALSGNPILLESVPFNKRTWSGGVFLGSCNGLLLVSHYSDLYLWNPTTRQCTRVLSIKTDAPSDCRFIGKSGLCYDSYSDDYKAVMVKDGYVVIISFRRKHLYNKICSFVDEDNDSLNRGPVVNEKLHWLINCSRNSNTRFPTLNRIVYFDPLTDEFIELPMPLVPNRKKESIIGLGVLEGCLCMARCISEVGDEIEHGFNFVHDVELGFDFNHEVEPGFIELLVLKEHVMGESWNSIFMMSNNFGISSLVPLGFSKNGEILMALNVKKCLAYNPYEMSLRDIHVQADSFQSYGPSYVESLVSPAAYSHEEGWIVEGPTVLDSFYCSGWEDWIFYDYCCFSDLSHSSKEDSSIEEDEDCVERLLE